MTSIPDLAPATPTRPEPGSRRPIVVLTGLSGAGLSTALKRLEDLGYESVDNLPLSLIGSLVAYGGEQGDDSAGPVAATVDTRSRNFSTDGLLARLDQLRGRPDLDVRLVYLDCADEVLLRRFTETRRRHPQALDRPVIDGIARERRILAPLRERADLLLDTSMLSIHDLRRLVAGHFRLGGEPALHVFATSFSFGQGVPREADLVFDVRFLTNPHYDPDLRPLTGLDPAVAARVASDPDYPGFFDRLTGLLEPLLPRYAQEGKSYLTIAVGCTGGKHRSVFVTEQLAGWLRRQGYKVGLAHRELERAGTGRPDPDRNAGAGNRDAG
jgi:UPF0042 nucleotide-binding protein